MDGLLMQYICGLYIFNEYVYLCSFHPVVWTDTKIDARKFHSKRELLEEIYDIRDNLKKELNGGRIYVLGVKSNNIVVKEEIDLENITIPQ